MSGRPGQRASVRRIQSASNAKVPDHFPWDVMYPDGRWLGVPYASDRGNRHWAGSAHKPTPPTVPLEPSRGQSQIRQLVAGPSAPTSSEGTRISSPTAQTFSPALRPATLGGASPRSMTQESLPIVTIPLEDWHPEPESESELNRPTLAAYLTRSQGMSAQPTPVVIEIWDDSSSANLSQSVERSSQWFRCNPTPRELECGSLGLSIAFTGATDKGFTVKSAFQDVVLEETSYGVLSQLRYSEGDEGFPGSRAFNLCLTIPAFDKGARRTLSGVFAVRESEDGSMRPLEVLAEVWWGRDPLQFKETATLMPETFVQFRSAEGVSRVLPTEDLFRNLTPPKSPQRSRYEIQTDKLLGADNPGVKWFWDCTVDEPDVGGSKDGYGIEDLRDESDVENPKGEFPCTREPTASCRLFLTMKDVNRGNESTLLIVTTHGKQRQIYRQEFFAGPFTEIEWSRLFESGEDFRTFLVLVLVFPALVWNRALDPPPS